MPPAGDAVHFAPYYAALAGELDAARGGTLFATHCGNCHQLGDNGIAVGPTLDGESGRPPESLLADVLQPNAKITAGYGTYLVKTKAGVSHVGVLASESATSLSVVQTGGASATVLRADVESVERLEMSLMPANLFETLKADELADVIAYIRSRPAADALVLFDDDPGFPGALADGRGSAKLDWSDAASGRACLTVDGFQRHARQVPGWDFAIRENPDKNAFRYLRLGMKSRGAEGMMIELAADSGFPPENQPIRTYFAGRNSTGWTSNELSRDVPREWQTFTIDLWQGNGDFTLTGIAFTVMGNPGSFDRIELLRERP